MQTPHPTWSTIPGWRHLLHWEDLQIYKQKPAQGDSDEAGLSWKRCSTYSASGILSVHRHHVCIKKRWDNWKKTSVICKLLIVLVPVLFCRDKTWRKVWVNSITHKRFCRNNLWLVIDADWLWYSAAVWLSRFCFHHTLLFIFPIPFLFLLSLIHCCSSLLSPYSSASSSPFIPSSSSVIHHILVIHHLLLLQGSNHRAKQKCDVLLFVKTIQSNSRED